MHATACNTQWKFSKIYTTRKACALLDTMGVSHDAKRQKTLQNKQGDTYTGT